MNQVIRDDLLKELDEVIEILKVREGSDIAKLEEVSNHTIHDASVFHDIDAIQLAVLVYSLYKIIGGVQDKEYQQILNALSQAKKALENDALGEYNTDITLLFSIIKKVDEKSGLFFREVLEAAKIKKGAQLFKHGLSLGKAAEILGITKWELSSYAGGTVYSEQHEEIVSAKKRMSYAQELFAVSGGSKR